MKLLFLEDHTFFAKEVIEYIHMFIDESIEISYANTYKEAEKMVEIHGKFDRAIIDFQLQNGRNGIEFVDKNKDNIGAVLFITGCIETSVLDALEQKNYKYLSKKDLLWIPLKKFLQN